MQHFLYIDPGTGSMLFSILIGATATLFFVGKAALLKLKVFFSGKKSGTSVDASYKPYVIWNEGRQYVTLFLPVVEEFEKRKIPLTYYTSYKDDPALTTSYEYVKTEYIGSGNTAFARLNLLSAGIVVMTTPGLDVYQLKRSKRVKHYSHLIHGTSDATIYRLFGLDFFDSVLLTGDYQKNGIRYLENLRGIKQKELVTVGLPYLDELQKKIEAIPEEVNHEFTVLVSPSWGKSAILTKYGERLLDELVKTNWHIIIRPHPQSKISEKDMLSRLEARYKDTPNFEWNYDQDNIYCLKRADVMISDFSGIIFDYAYLFEKPIFYANADFDLKPYDAYWMPNNGKDEWTFKTLKKIGIELNENDFPHIKEIIETARDSSERIAAIQKARDEAWMHRGESAKKVVDFMVNCGKI
ncbi:MAG: CDP-glycerol glycerophosphotransferase family protein [Treponema sp.]|nr:CDP-glycerol glycerophosphotransferase family protein [Treponema sp.]